MPTQISHQSSRLEEMEVLMEYNNDMECSSKNYILHNIFFVHVALMLRIMMQFGSFQSFISLSFLSSVP